MNCNLTLDPKKMIEMIEDGSLLAFLKKHAGEEVATPTPAPAPAPQAPVTPVTPVAPVAPEVPAMPAVPTGNQEYTLDALSGAATKLMFSPTGEPVTEMQTALIGMMQSFGVNSMGELDPSQYGAVALKLRELGAEI